MQVTDLLMVNYCNVCILQIQCPQQTVTLPARTRELGMTEKEKLQKTFCLQAGCKSSTKTSRFPDVIMVHMDWIWRSYFSRVEYYILVHRYYFPCLRHVSVERWAYRSYTFFTSKHRSQYTDSQTELGISWIHRTQSTISRVKVPPQAHSKHRVITRCRGACV